MTNSELDRMIAKLEAVKDYTNARDDFAIAALMPAYQHCKDNGISEAREIARYAYDLADAMMEERQGMIEVLEKYYVGVKNG